MEGDSRAPGGAEEMQNQREFGEVIASLRLLTEEVKGLRMSQSTELGKLHERINQVLADTVRKEEHNRLAAEVREVRDGLADKTPIAKHDELHTTVNHLRERLGGNRASLRWLRDGFWFAAGLAGTAALYLLR